MQVGDHRGLMIRGIKIGSMYYAAGSNLSLEKLKGATKKVHSSGLKIKYCGKDFENQGFLDGQFQFVQVYFWASSVASDTIFDSRPPK